MDEACELGLIIPTEDEMKDQINSQKTDFMTTFAKKKSGAGSAPPKRQVGGIGLMSKDKLIQKHVFDPKAPPEKVVPIKSRLGGAKYQAASRSDESNIEKMTSDIAEQVDNLLNPQSSKYSSEQSSSSKNSGKVSNSCKNVGKISSESNLKHNAVPSIYQKNKHKISPRTGADKNGDKKVNKPELKPKPTVAAKAKPDRDYKKPWQRPNTAGQQAEAAKKKAFEDSKKDIQKKKVDNIVARRKQFRPALVKKTSEIELKANKDIKRTVTEDHNIEVE